jgi:putative transposase
MVAGAWFGRVEKAEALRRAQARSTNSASLEGFGVSETCCCYSPKLKDETAEIADLLAGLTDARKTWGFGLYFLHLRNVKGHPWNHKRVYPLALWRLPAIAIRRIFCTLELTLSPLGPLLLKR